MITRRSAMASAVVTSMLAKASVSRAAAGPPSLKALSRAPELVGASLSPDGETIALLVERRDGGERASYINLIRASDPTAKPLRVSLGNREVEQVLWASNNRLLIGVFMRREASFKSIGRAVNPGGNPNIRRMLAVNTDGSDPVVMFAGQTDVLQSDPDLTLVIDTLPGDPQHVLMRGWHPDSGMYALHQVDVYTGKTALVERNSPDTIGWVTQNGRAVLRWDILGENTLQLYARAPEAKDWTFVRNVRRKSDLSRADFEIIGATEEPGVFLAIAREGDEPSLALRTFDLQTLKVGPPISSRPDRDVDGALIDDRRRYVAAIYTTDRTDYEFVDKAVTPHFRGMDKFFQGEASVNVVGFNRDQTRFVVRADGPRTPGEYYLYDRGAQKFEALGPSRPWLSPETLAPMEPLDVRTRDGSTIRAYLTQPLASGPRPLVVLPHGGPELRDRMEFDVFAQALAAQGWMVLQPNFRGSGGYGQAFADAGRKRWGDLMQEDVEDAVAQVLATGRVEPNKVAIMGASYGGYAALMGAVRKPEFYKAAVSIAGVTDLPDMLAAERLDGADGPAYKYWVRTIGDPKADAERLRSSSPRFRATEIKAPVLLIHGLSDRTVLPRQSRAMAQALRSAGKPVEHLELELVGHGYWRQEVMEAILQRSVDFIRKSFA